MSSTPASQGTPASAGTLTVGALAPDFSALDQHARPFRLSEQRGRPVVVFFYPRDFTPACTAQSCAFRDAYAELAGTGAVVVGVSGDSDESHAKFAARHALPYALISDADGSIRKAWGVPRSAFGLLPGRVTYVLDATGVVRMVFSSQLRAGEHAQRALRAVASLG
jgi:peroxiredoxin Q/BCP